MAKIQCPHCQAINEGVSLDQPCRQCGTIMNAPLSAIDTGKGAPTSTANQDNAGGATDATTQKAANNDQPADTASLTQAEGGEKGYE